MSYELINSDQNKQGRLQLFVFEDQYNSVHMDQKRFYFPTEKHSYYVSVDEDLNVRANVKRQEFITKVKFIATVTRPRCIALKNSTLTEK